MIVSLLALLTSPALLQQQTVAQVLDNVRAAVGYSALESFAGSIEMTGSALHMGSDADFRFVFTPDGKYVFDLDGPTRLTRAWDGERGWELDWTSSPMPINFSSVEHQHADSWVIGHRWLAPDGPFDITMVEEGGDTYTLNLKQKDGRLNQKVVVDRETWLPKSSSYMIGVGLHRIELSDWKATRGLKLPHRIDVTRRSVKGWIDVQEVRPISDESRPFKMPSWRLSNDTKYDQSKNGPVETKRARSGHFLVKPTINGEDVGWFILDTGASAMGVDKGVAERFGATEFGSWMATGAGGSVLLSFVKLADFSLGPATVDELTYFVLDMKGMSQALGVEIGGLVGYDFFRRAVLEIDVEEFTVAFFDPRSYELKKGTWTDLLFDAHHATTPAKFEGGREGVFAIDTGSPMGLVFNSPAVKEFDLLEGRETTELRLRGLGGSSSAKVGAIEYFEIDGYRFENQSAVMSVSDSGAFASKHLTGMIGNPLLKPFTVVFDYANQRLAFVRKEG